MVPYYFDLAPLLPPWATLTITFVLGVFSWLRVARRVRSYWVAAVLALACGVAGVVTYSLGLLSHLPIMLFPSWLLGSVGPAEFFNWMAYREAVPEVFLWSLVPVSASVAGAATTGLLRSRLIRASLVSLGTLLLLKGAELWSSMPLVGFAEALGTLFLTSIAGGLGGMFVAFFLHLTEVTSSLPFQEVLTLGVTVLRRVGLGLFGFAVIVILVFRVFLTPREMEVKARVGEWRSLNVSLTHWMGMTFSRQEPSSGWLTSVWVDQLKVSADQPSRFWLAPSERSQVRDLAFGYLAEEEFGELTVKGRDGLVDIERRSRMRRAERIEGMFSWLHVYPLSTDQELMVLAGQRHQELLSLQGDGSGSNCIVRGLGPEGLVVEILGVEGLVALVVPWEGDWVEIEEEARRQSGTEVVREPSGLVVETGDTRVVARGRRIEGVPCQKWLEVLNGRVDYFGGEVTDGEVKSGLERWSLKSGDELALGRGHLEVQVGEGGELEVEGWVRFFGINGVRLSKTPWEALSAGMRATLVGWCLGVIGAIVGLYYHRAKKRAEAD